MCSRKDEQGVDESIRFDQSPIQINAEGQAFCSSGFCLRLGLGQPLPRVRNRKKPGNRDLEAYPRCLEGGDEFR